MDTVPEKQFFVKSIKMLYSGAYEPKKIWEVF
jgi:hypothetical protein